MPALGKPGAGLRAHLAQPSIAQGLWLQACGSSLNISQPDRLSLGVRLSYRLGVGECKKEKEEVKKLLPQ